MLLDTSGLLCLYDRRDPRQSLARQFYQSAIRCITHDYVLCKFVALAHARNTPRAGALAFVVDLLDNPDVEVLWVDELWHRAALTILQKRLDKTYSLCDVVSFLAMREQGILEALTTDHHFEQEGFTRLLPR